MTSPQSRQPKAPAFDPPEETLSTARMTSILEPAPRQPNPDTQHGAEH